MGNFMKTWPNLISMFIEQAGLLGDKPFLWSKKDGKYKSTSWMESLETVLAIARSLKSIGIKKGDRILLCSESRSEWPLANFAIMASGGITVPAYTTNTVNDHAHIIANSGATGVIVSTKELATNLVPAARQAGNIKFIISIEELETKQTSGIEFFSWDSLIEKGKDEPDTITENIHTISREDVAVIIYTSGTGGAPKGVMLPHRAILHNCNGVSEVIQDLGLSDEVFLSFLPLSHSYEYTAGICFPVYIGAQVYFAEGLEHLSTNMAEAKPTIMTAVPRLYELMHARITKGVKVASGPKQKLFMKAVELGTKKYHDPNSLTLKEKIIDKIVDKLVRNKIRANFGGRLKVLASGGAPLNSDIGIFFTALGLKLLQGYGQTESAPVISLNLLNNVKMETVGPPIPNTEVKIADDGEILVRGDLLMKGYWENKHETNETIKDGWLHTGDIGQMDDQNYIQITDRKKDIIVNSGGDNISPQRIEGFLTLEPEIAQAMVYGDKKPHVVALIVPDREFAKEWAIETGNSENLEEIISHDDFRKIINEALDRANKHLSVIERVRRLTITTQEFTVDNEMMTPTLKVRRHIIKERYLDQLEKLYSK
jgi:long-chain acyl-CoA synthetase